MSIYHQQIVLYGYRIDDVELDFEDYDNLRPSEVNEGEVTVVIDGLGSDYKFIGVAQALTGKSEVAPDLPLTKIESPEPEQVAKLVSMAHTLDIDVSDREANHYTFTHTT